MKPSGDGTGALAASFDDDFGFDCESVDCAGLAKEDGCADLGGGICCADLGCDGLGCDGLGGGICCDGLGSDIGCEDVGAGGAAFDETFGGVPPVLSGGICGGDFPRLSPESAIGR
ncbi:MAG TPA: hypothetical protein VM580_34345 [Labilithrix sp.]|nr:hypothetical protein [Labilithrix sp.]